MCMIQKRINDIDFEKLEETIHIIYEEHIATVISQNLSGMKEFILNQYQLLDTTYLCAERLYEAHHYYIQGVEK